ncbi:MAG TPA: hypothetical protein VGR72_09595, partial [Candidatus Acidoferrales bacterium]|nr:hypothetical protein [Candidatus Acidoferrales bacterium]
PAHAKAAAPLVPDCTLETASILTSALFVHHPSPLCNSKTAQLRHRLFSRAVTESKRMQLFTLSSAEG